MLIRDGHISSCHLDPSTPWLQPAGPLTFQPLALLGSSSPSGTGQELRLHFPFQQASTLPRRQGGDPPLRSHGVFGCQRGGEGQAELLARLDCCQGRRILAAYDERLVDQLARRVEMSLRNDLNRAHLYCLQSLRTTPKAKESKLFKY